MRRSVLLAVIVAMPLVAACGAPDAGPVGDVTDASPEVVASPEVTEVVATAAARATDPGWSDGFVLTMNGHDDPTFRPERLVNAFDLFVIGSVIEELPARWTTPDGLRPASLDNEVPHPYTIVTPFVLELGVPDYLRSLTNAVIPLNEQGAAKLAADATQVVILIEGGTVGKDSVVNLPAEPLMPGQSILIGLLDPQSIEPDPAFEHQFVTDAGPGWWGLTRFFLQDDGMATFYDQTLPAKEMVSRILDELARKTSGR